MRSPVDKAKLNSFFREIGNRSEGPGKVYIVGGSTALLLDIRTQTVDIDIKLDPEPKGIFAILAMLKESLSINVELASPDQFVPALSDWQKRSEFITRSGQVDFYHYDFYGQAFAKIVRGHQVDLSDVRDLIRLEKINLSTLQSLIVEVMPEFDRYPALDKEDVQRRLNEFIETERTLDL
jgi:hypothetical protein